MIHGYTYYSFQRYENKTSISKIILKTNSTYTYLPQYVSFMIKSLSSLLYEYVQYDMSFF